MQVNNDKNSRCQMKADGIATTHNHNKTRVILKIFRSTDLLSTLSFPAWINFPVCQEQTSKSVGWNVCVFCSMSR